MEINKEDFLKSLEDENTKGLVLESLKESGYNVFANGDFADYEKDIIGKKYKTWQDEDESLIKDTFGIDKLPNERKSDYLVRASNERINNLRKEYEQKMNEIKAKPQDSDKEDSGLKDIKSLEEQFRTELAKKEEAIEELNKAREKDSKTIEFFKVFAPLKDKFKKDLPEYHKAYEDGIVKETIENSIIIDGRLVIADENGNPKRDPATLTYIDVADVLKEKFKDSIDTPSTVVGSGAMTSKHVQADMDGLDIDIPYAPKTKDDIADILKKANIKQGVDQRYSKYYRLMLEKFDIK